MKLIHVCSNPRPSIGECVGKTENPARIENTVIIVDSPPPQSLFLAWHHLFVDFRGIGVLQEIKMSPPVIQFPPRLPVFQSVSPGPGDVFPALLMPFFLGIVKHCQHDEWQKYHAPYGLSRVFYAPRAFGVGRW